MPARRKKTGRSFQEAPGARCRYDEICSAFDQTRQAIYSYTERTVYSSGIPRVLRKSRNPFLVIAQPGPFRVPTLTWCLQNRQQLNPSSGANHIDNVLSFTLISNFESITLRRDGLGNWMPE